MNDELTTPQRWLLAIRPRTLTASIVPVIVGLALAPPRSGGDVAIAAITLAAAFAIQAAVNLANDYYDYVGGIDTHERVGPTRVVQSGLLDPQAVRRGFVLCVAAAAVLGAVLIARGGLPILVVGFVSLVCAYAYAGGPWPLASHGLGDVFVFAHGKEKKLLGKIEMDQPIKSTPVAVNGTLYIMTETNLWAIAKK